MARQATRLRAQCPLPGSRLSFACAVGAAATVTPYLSTDSRGRSPEPLCDLPHRLTGRNTTRNLFALIAPRSGYTADRTSDEIRDGTQHANRACSGNIHPYIAFIARRRGDRIGISLLRLLTAGNGM